MTAADLLADQKLPFADFPTETIRIAGRDFPCLVIRDVSMLVWEQGGRLEDPVISVAIERSLLEASGVASPEEGDLLQFRGITYRAANTAAADAQSSFTMDLVSPAK